MTLSPSLNGLGWRPWKKKIMAALLKDQWAKIGINVEINALDPTTYQAGIYPYPDVKYEDTAAIGTGATVGASASFTTPLLDPELQIHGDLTADDACWP